MQEAANPDLGANLDDTRMALVLVQNTVTNDSRVLREAATLRELGFEVLIAGVVSREEQQTELRLDGIHVVRLAPLEFLRRWLRQRSEAQAPTSATRSSSQVAAVGTHRASRPRLAAILARMALASAYYAQGVALVWRTSPILVHANDYNTMWIGVAAKILRGSRLIYDAHELWPDQGRAEWRPWLVACEWLFVRLADATIASNPAISETIAKRYRVPLPSVVRNVPAYLADSPQPPEGLRAGEQPLALYIGGLAPERGIEQTIAALALAPELRLRFMGNGDDSYRAKLASCAARAGVSDRIEYRSPVEPAIVANTIAGADMGIALTEPTCLNNVLSLPNKLFEYAAAGLPIIASDLPVLGSLVRDGGIGEVVPPQDVSAIAEAMRRLADPIRNAEVRERVRSFGQRVTWPSERRVLEDAYRSTGVTPPAWTHDHEPSQ